MVTRAEWAESLLRLLKAPVTVRNLRAVVSWESAEGTTAKWNPLATTKKMPGSTNFNSTGVQNYDSPQQGLEATIKTLREPGHNYAPILRRLHRNRWAYWTLRAVAASSWGTGSLALRLLPYVRRDYDRYAGQPIGQ